MSNAKEVGRAIRSIRQTYGDTQQEFSNRVGIATSTLARYETGVQRPKRSNLARFLAMCTGGPALADQAVVLARALKEGIAPPDNTETSQDRLSRIRGILTDPDVTTGGLRCLEDAVSKIREIVDE